MRGSIPLHWTQEANPVNPKPDIICKSAPSDLAVLPNDKEYTSAKRHIGDLFKQFSTPVVLLNLTKENNARECTLSDEYDKSVNNVINPTLPRSVKVPYFHYDMKRRKK